MKPPFAFLTPKSNKVAPDKRKLVSPVGVQSNGRSSTMGDFGDGRASNPFDDEGVKDVHFSVSVCSPPKKPRRDIVNDENLNQNSIRSRWNETAEIMDFDKLPLFRATPPSEDEENAAVVKLDFFVRNTVLEFPAVPLNKMRKMPLQIENPKDFQQSVDFKKCATSKGFSICGLTSESVLQVPAGEYITQYIQFTPPESAKSGEAFRDVWHFYVDSSYWVKLVLIAKTVIGVKKTQKRCALWMKEPKIPVKLSKGMAGKALGVSNVLDSKEKTTPSKPKRKPTITTPNLGLKRLIKKPCLSVPSRDLFFDRESTSKQLYALTNYINQEVFRCDTTANGTQKCVPESGGRIVLFDERNVVQWKQRVFAILKSPEVSSAIANVEEEIHSGHLAIRPDIKLTFDIALKKRLIELVLHFNSTWLNLVLDIVFADCMERGASRATKSLNCDKNDIMKFLNAHFVSRKDLDIQTPSQFALAQQSEKHSGKSGVLDELHRHIMRKFFLLVLILDKAKLGKVLPHDPCLFEVSADLKSTSSLTCQFCRLCLKSEGSILKHLGVLGYHLEFCQVALDEYLLVIKDIERDLRDGVLIVKALELLTDNKYHLSKSIRYPCDNRSRKLHNISIAIDFLKENIGLEEIMDGNGEEMLPKDIVEGNLDKTAALLWFICLDLKLCSNFVAIEDVKTEWQKIVADNSRASLPAPHLTGTESVDLLLLGWAFACLAAEATNINEQLQIKQVSYPWPGTLDDMSTIDGVVAGAMLCSLLHYYQPHVIGLEHVKFPSIHQSNGVDTSLSDNINLFYASVAKLGGVPRLIYLSPTNTSSATLSGQCLSPGLKDSTDSLSSTSSLFFPTSFSCELLLDSTLSAPSLKIDRKVFILTLSLLFARLKSIRREIDASKLIQRTWNNYKQCKSAKDILKSLRSQKRRTEAEQIIECDAEEIEPGVIDEHEEILKTTEQLDNILTIKDNLELENEEDFLFENAATAAVRIQTWWRARRQFIDYGKMRNASILMQSYMRGYLTRSKLFADKETAPTLFTFYARLSRSNRVSKDSAARRLLYTQNSPQVDVFVENFAALRIQDFFKCSLNSLKLRSVYITKRQAVLTIQNWLRNRKRQKDAKALLHLLRKEKLGKENREREKKSTAAAVLIQRHFRASLFTKSVRTDFLRKRAAAITIQSCTRAHLCRKRYLKIVNAANFITVWYCSVKERKRVQANYKTTITNIVFIQSHIRGYLQREQFKKENKAATVLQSNFKALIERKRFLKLKSSAIKVQKLFRKKLEQQKQIKQAEYLKQVVTVQSLVRGYIARKRYEKMHASLEPVKKHFIKIRSAVIIQRIFRRERARLLMLYYRRRLNRSAVKIQSLWRGFCLRRDLDFFKQNVIVIQRACKRYLECKQPLEDLKRAFEAIIVIQSAWRGYVVRRRITVPKAKRAVAIISQFYFKHRVAHFRRKLEHSSAVKIQSVWRGYCTRKADKLHLLLLQNEEQHLRESSDNASSVSTSEMTSAITTTSTATDIVCSEEVRRKRKRLSEICGNLQRLDPESLPLCRRMNAGLSSLLHMNTVSKILSVLSEIEVCTRLSELCCQRFAQSTLDSSGITPSDTNDTGDQLQTPSSVLLELMERCCRSVADQDILLLCVDILINVSKVKSCHSSLSGDPLLFPLLLNQLSKNNPSACKGTSAAKLYCHTCFLLQILLQFENCQKLVRSCSRNIEKLRRQHQTELNKEKNSHRGTQLLLHKQSTFPTDNNNIASASGRKKSSHVKMGEVGGLDLRHLHPEWELCHVRIEPNNSVIQALAALLSQLKAL